MLDTTRQTNLMPDPNRYSVVVIGAGAIGSTVTAMLAQTGFINIEVYDHDKLSHENYGGGTFNTEMDGQPKVESVADIAYKLTGEYAVVPIAQKYKGQEVYADIVILAVDSLEARKAIWENNKFSAKYFIDGRMGGTGCACYGFELEDPKSVQAYLNTYEYKDADLACGEKSTRFVVMRVASQIGEFIYALLMGKPLPFVQLYDASDSTNVTIYLDKQGENQNESTETEATIGAAVRA